MEGKTRGLIVALHTSLSSFKEISFAYLFGSAVRSCPARGHGWDFRDIDIAVYLLPCPASSYERFKLAMRIGRAVERAISFYREVDVQILNEAPPFFQYKVIKTGQLILQRDARCRIRYEAHLLSQYLDYQPMWEEFINRYFNGDNGMEQRAEVFQHFQEMDEALADWERYRRDITAEMIRSNRDTRNMVMHAMLISIQSCIDIANHIIAQRDLRRPSTYRETFEILTEAGVIPQELGEELADLAGFRNVLVHLYWRIDLQRVYEILQNGLTPLYRFRDVIRRSLGPRKPRQSEGPEAGNDEGQDRRYRRRNQFRPAPHMSDRGRSPEDHSR